MEKYYIYKITFIVVDNDTQKKALDVLNKHLPGQIIVNTSLPVPKLFAEGNFIGNSLEVESETHFTENELYYAMILTNASIEIAAIATIDAVGENIIEDNNTVYTDLVDLSF